MVSSSQLRFAAFRAFGEVIPKNCIECPYPCGASAPISVIFYELKFKGIPIVQPLYASRTIEHLWQVVQVQFDPNFQPTLYSVAQRK